MEWSAWSVFDEDMREPFGNVLPMWSFLAIMRVMVEEE